MGGNLAQSALLRGWHTIVGDTRFQEAIRDVAWREIDITRRESVEQLLDELSPDVVVNLAALAEIDRAEREKDMAWRVNVLGAKLLAEGCARRDIRQIFFSSDAVFDGLGGPYREDDPTNPVNYYGLTKAEAERAVLAAQPEACIVRISLVLGYPLMSGNSYLASLKARLQAGQEIYCPLDEIRTPVDVLTLCDCVLELAKDDYRGVLHIGCRDSIDRYHLTRRIAGEMGYPTDGILPQATVDAAADRAPRHKRGILDVTKAMQTLDTPLIGLNETIKRAVSGKYLPA